ncbi:MAG: type II secretion system F family protein [Lachnospiraceae bacterium]|nr:type II secretion system F family protein [Lachnospiraceae bacterium]MDD3614828.1 type II secretion system F family protein [Lachnospiraceae bacterium]
MLEWIRYGGEGLLLCIAIDYLFYSVWWMIFLLIPVGIWWVLQRKNACQIKRKQRLNLQFKDALSALRISLQAGYSLENAVLETYKDLQKIYQSQDEIVQEFRYLVRQMRIQVPVEQLFVELSDRSGVEDIENFASVFSIAKRTGGNLAAILEQTAVRLSDKIDVKKEIEASIASKKFEQNIMALMPAGIILYMRICSPDFLNGLYGNMLGIAIMTVCLGIYLGAYQLGRKIVTIEV